MQTRAVRSPATKLLRNICRKAASQWPWPVPVEVLNRILYVDLRSAIGRAICVKGTFDPAVYEAIKSTLSRSGVFLDVGANVGLYSILALDIVGHEGAVHAFEIDPRPLRCLKKTKAKGNIANLVIHEVAVGEKIGVGYLVKRPDCGHSTVTVSGSGQNVPVMPLDYILQNSNTNKVQCIKIDVEGGELAVLKGARHLLERQRPIIVCELVGTHLSKHNTSENEVIALLQSLDYLINPINDSYTPCIIAKSIKPMESLKR